RPNLITIDRLVLIRARRDRVADRMLTLHHLLSAVHVAGRNGIQYILMVPHELVELAGLRRQTANAAHVFLCVGNEAPNPVASGQAAIERVHTLVAFEEQVRVVFLDGKLLLLDGLADTPRKRSKGLFANLPKAFVLPPHRGRSGSRWVNR
ncbi:hypothetical protein, partial [Shinella granuli]|uniref:hypothetical protein n=1 Tax=Shinella granuli TaxID=323621 RepID=UPI00406BB69B